MKNFLILLLFSALAIISAAQQKPVFSSQTYVGIVSGETDTELQLQSVNGISWKKWFTGAGVGIDWYSFRSVPVFASVNRILFQKGKRSFFVSGDGGINFPWDRSYYYSGVVYRGADTKAGLYWGGGFGYRFGVGKSDNALLLHLGYSFKQIQEKIINEFPCFSPPCIPIVEKYDYRLKRISIRVGWGF